MRSRKQNILTPLSSLAAIALGAFMAVTSVSAQPQDLKIREVNASPVVKKKLADARKRIQTKNLKFNVGMTYATEKGVKRISGGLKPNVSPGQATQQNNLASQLVRIDDDARKLAKVGDLTATLACSPTARKWDWRTRGKVTPVKQQHCGNCWAYAAMSAFESSYLIRNNRTVDGSEQYIVSNNNNSAGTCAGGYANRAIEFLVTRGTALDSVLPDSGTNGSPNPSMATPYDGVAWGWVSNSEPGDPGVNAIKTALCERGPVATWIDSGGTFGDYVSGVYDDDDDQQPGYDGVGHFVTIVGWDQDKGAWIIKNSWGDDWGETAGHGSERGYGYITYGTHSVGSWVSWVRAEDQRYTLPVRYYELMPVKKLLLREAIVNPVIKEPVKQPVITRPVVGRTN